VIGGGGALSGKAAGAGSTSSAMAVDGLWLRSVSRARLSSGKRPAGQAESRQTAAAGGRADEINLKIFNGRFCANSVGEADNRSGLSDVLAAAAAAPVNHDLITHHDDSSLRFAPQEFAESRSIACWFCALACDVCALIRTIECL
jgi:hypothetical protein